MTTLASRRVELRIPGRAEFVAVARIAAAAIASRLDFCYDAIDDIKLAVGEACANAIEHACPEGEGAEIHLSFSLEKQCLVIEVRDSGPGFDPKALEPAGEQAPSERGLGLLLISSIMDKVEWVTPPEGGTTVIMTKHLGAPAPEGSA
jgi:serine/threonine-protein kinase RsbW